MRAPTPGPSATTRPWRQLPALPSPYLPCAMAVMSSQVAREVIPADIREQVHALWLEAAEKSLATNQTTFAIVPFVKLTRPGGYLEMLRARAISSRRRS